MPILLDTAFDPGDHDPGNTYPRAKIVDITIVVPRQAVAVTLDFGDVVDSIWTVGAASKKLKVVFQDAPYADPPTIAFTDLMATLTADGENIYDAIKRIAYVEAQSVAASLAGSIE